MKDVLDQNQTLNVAKTVKPNESPGLFTLGYEGRSLEEFLNILLRENIKTLCDVRKNAFSMKYGFSKTTLKNACDNVGIEYMHIPALGINSSERKDLKTSEDYAELFEKYKAGVLAHTEQEQKTIVNLIQSEKRVALMCFEAAPAMCHRSHLAESILSFNTTDLPLVHL